MRRHPSGQVTVPLEEAWRGLPPQSTEPGLEFVSAPVRTFHGDPDNPRQGVARFDFLVGWVHPETLKPIHDSDVLWWELLPEREQQSTKSGGPGG